VFGNQVELIQDLIKCGRSINEHLWHLPIAKCHREAIKGATGDITNSQSKLRGGGASTAAAFLERFVNPGVNWAHIDIAGAGKSVMGYAHYSSGNTAIPM
jgi:leucyl aminopeptidase